MEVIMDDDGRMNDEWCVCVCRSGWCIRGCSMHEKSDETRNNNFGGMQYIKKPMCSDGYVWFQKYSTLHCRK